MKNEFIIKPGTTVKLHGMPVELRDRTTVISSTDLSNIDKISPCVESLRNNMELITCQMLEDLGFELITHDHDGMIHMGFEIGYRHSELDPFNLILVDYKNGSWHFAQRKNAFNGIGKMVWLDDLIVGFQFITGNKLLK